MHKINGTYYIFVTKPADSELVLKSSSPFGPYQGAHVGFAHQRPALKRWLRPPRWHREHRGQQTSHYVAFMDAYPGGRIPVVAPLAWSNDGWPQLVATMGLGQDIPYAGFVEQDRGAANRYGRILKAPV